MAVETSGRVLILGAGGKIGRMIRSPACRDLWDGLEPVGVSRDPRHGLCWRPCDDPAALPQAGAVVVLWGVRHGNDAALAQNAALGLLAQAVGRAVGAARVLHMSSAAVYGPRAAPWSEDDPPAPSNAYGAAKLEMERAVASAGEPESVCLRTANVAGAESLFASLVQDGPVTLDRFGDGRGPLRSYIAPQDLVRVFVALIRSERPLPRVLNVAAPHPVRMQAIVEAAGHALRWRAAPRDAVASLVLDTRRLARLCPLPARASAPDYLVAAAAQAGASV